MFSIELKFGIVYVSKMKTAHMSTTSALIKYLTVFIPVYNYFFIILNNIILETYNCIKTKIIMI